jgi:MFS family permease
VTVAANASRFFPRHHLLTRANTPPPPAFRRSLVSGCVFSLLPYWSAALGGPHPPAGLMRAYALSQLAFVPLICRASDSLGRRAPLAACLAASSLALCGVAGAASLPQLRVAALLAGACAAAQPLCAAAVADAAAAAVPAGALGRAWAFSALTVAAALGYIGGPMGGHALAAKHGLHAAAGAAAAVSALAAVFALLALRDDAPLRHSRAGSNGVGSSLLALARAPGKTEKNEEDDAENADAGDAGSATSEALPLVALRGAAALALHAFASVLFKGHAERFALSAHATSAAQACMGGTQVAVWFLLAPFAARALGARRLQAASLAGVSLSLGTWAVAPAAGAVALPLAGLALASALFRTSNDVLLSKAASGRAGALFGLAHAAHDGARQLGAPAAAQALARLPRAGGAEGVALFAAALAAAAAACAAVAGAQAERREAAEAEERREAALEAAAAAALAARAAAAASAAAVTSLSLSSPPQQQLRIATSAAAAAPDGGGAGAFSGTVVVRRGASATRFAAADAAYNASYDEDDPMALAAGVAPATRAESAELAALVSELLQAEQSLTTRRAATAAARDAATQVAVIQAALNGVEAAEEGGSGKAEAPAAAEEEGQRKDTSGAKKRGWW